MSTTCKHYKGEGSAPKKAALFILRELFHFRAVLYDGAQWCFGAVVQAFK